MIREVLVFPDPKTTCRALASAIAEAARAALERTSRFSLVVPGGRTPQTLFRQLSTEFRTTVDWPRVHLFWTDERAVPPDDPESNFGAARASLLGPLAVPPSNVHRLPGEVRPLAEAARDAETELRRFFGVGPSAGLPESTFDFVVLGVGPDGHTASVFPSKNEPDPVLRWVVATPAPDLPPRVPRLTFTLPLIDRSREVAFLVNGTEKQAVVHRILVDASDDLPAARVAAQERLRWFLDAEAAGSVPPTP